MGSTAESPPEAALLAAAASIFDDETTEQICALLLDASGDILAKLQVGPLPAGCRPPPTF